jgi:hypothetical protein
MLAVVLALLVVVPLVLLAILPMLVPVLCTALLVWLIVRASRTHPVPQPVSGETRGR